jgi:hypothetical protein
MQQYPAENAGIMTIAEDKAHRIRANWLNA